MDRPRVTPRGNLTTAVSVSAIERRSVMHRRFLHLLTWASLGVFAATAAVWCRGYFVTDVCYYRHGGPLVAFDSRRGDLSLLVQHRRGSAFYGLRHRSFETHFYPLRVQLRRPPDTREWHVAGFAWRSSADAGHWVATVPCWFVALGTGALPAVRLGATRFRGSRALRGACPSCGYDLRATPDRCPECGVPARPPAGAAA